MKFGMIISRLIWFALFIFLVANGLVYFWFGLFVLSLIAALFVGRVYCGYICPLNLGMMPAAKLSQKLGIQKKMDPSMARQGRKVLPWILLLVSGAVFLIALLVKGHLAPVMVIWFIVSIMVTLRYPPFVFHNRTCPFGAVQKVFGGKATACYQVEEEKCTCEDKMKPCVKVCPSKAVGFNPQRGKANVEKSMCFQCGRCKEACPKDAIRYKKI